MADRRASIWAFLRRMYVNSGGLYEPTPTAVATRIITNAEMKTLRARPIEVIPSIPNRIVLPVQSVYSSVGNVVARNGNNAVALYIQMSGGVFLKVSPDIPNNVLLGGAARLHRAGLQTSTLDNASVRSLVNKPTVLRNSGAGEFGAGGAGNNLQIVVSYTVLPYEKLAIV